VQIKAIRLDAAAYLIQNAWKVFKVGLPACHA
jgi:hypothetical protein